MAPPRPDVGDAVAQAVRRPPGLLEVPHALITIAGTARLRSRAPVYGTCGQQVPGLSA
jgi:hypothetical protein